MSDTDTNTISLTYSKDFQPLIETAFDDIRQYFKDKAKNELVLEQAKIKATKDKWDAALKTLNRNGALDHILLQASNYFLNDHSKVSNQTSGKTDEDYASRVKNSKSTRAEKSTLVSLITKLNEYIDSDPDFRRSLNSVIMKTSVYELICNLLKCTSEDDALVTLNRIRLDLLVEDMPYLIHLNNALTSKEKELVGKIVNFES